MILTFIFTCSLFNFNDMSKHPLVSWLLLLLVVVVVVLVFFGGEGGRGWWYVLFEKKDFDGKSVMSMFCNVIMLILLYLHVCVTRTGWKIRPRPKTVILSIKKSNQIKSLSLLTPSLPPLSYCVQFQTEQFLAPVKYSSIAH